MVTNEAVKILITVQQQRRRHRRRWRLLKCVAWISVHTIVNRNINRFGLRNILYFMCAINKKKEMKRLNIGICSIIIFFLFGFLYLMSASHTNNVIATYIYFGLTSCYRVSIVIRWEFADFFCRNPVNLPISRQRWRKKKQAS